MILKEKSKNFYFYRTYWNEDNHGNYVPIRYTMGYRYDYQKQTFLITMAKCNPKDTFVKKKGRELIDKRLNEEGSGIVLRLSKCGMIREIIHYMEKFYSYTVFSKDFLNPDNFDFNVISRSFFHNVVEYLMLGLKNEEE